MNCANCGIEFEGRTDARFCSPKCRVTFSRKSSLVTDNVTVSDQIVTDNFKFTVKYKPLNTSQDSLVEKYAKVRTAKYWYDVPLGALPVYEKGWPKMPDYMNGRQYFLWWKNEFKENDGTPEILNVFGARDNITYVQAGDNSRRWGA
jgi:hypothetical protein